jgi:hypothetical protein
MVPFLSELTSSSLLMPQALSSFANTHQLSVFLYLSLALIVTHLFLRNILSTINTRPSISTKLSQRISTT